MALGKGVEMALKIWVTVKPQAKKDEVRKITDGEYIALVTTPPRDGKANRALIEALADYFSVAKSSIRIVRGQSGRRKLVEIG